MPADRPEVEELVRELDRIVADHDEHPGAVTKRKLRNAVVRARDALTPAPSGETTTGGAEDVARVVATDRLHRKYIVDRTDGSSGPGGKHEHCDYFVLDLVHDRLAHGPLEVYARAAEREHPFLADDLYDKLSAPRPGMWAGNFCSGIGRDKCGPDPEGGYGDPGVIPMGNGVMLCVRHGKRYHEMLVERGLPGLGSYALGAIVRREERGDHRKPGDGGGE
jgi:hypothetical protein